MRRPRLAALAIPVAVLAVTLGAPPAQARVVMAMQPSEFQGGLPVLAVASDDAPDTIAVRCNSAGRTEVVGVGVAPVRCTDFYDLRVVGFGGNDRIDLSGMRPGPGKSKLDIEAHG